MAIVMALLLKHFIVEAYKIPTGSMQPTLIGDERTGIKDRILVDKLSYVVRDPKRWEVAVFRYPLDRSKNFVKRIVGVGPEEFRIQHGDLWSRAGSQEDWRPLRRPRAVQQATWKALEREGAEESRWRLETPGVDWSVDGRALRARGTGSIAFGGREAILDRYLDGYPEPLPDLFSSRHPSSAQHPVGDLRLAGRVRALAGTEALTIELKEGERRYRMTLPGPAAPADARARIEIESLGTWDRPDVPRADSTEAYRLPADEWVEFGAQNMDDLLELEIDGQALSSLEIPPASNQYSGLRLELEGAGADFEDLTAYRDIYYTSDTSEAIEIPAGCFFMMGDNTQDSSDSREWSFTRYRLNDGPLHAGDSSAGAGNGEPLIVRGNFRRGENPRTVGFGNPEGPQIRLVDEWGEAHWFRAGAGERLPPEPAPFVERGMIQGKALAVFWPLDPRRKIYRWKWVN